MKRNFKIDLSLICLMSLSFLTTTSLLISIAQAQVRGDLCNFGKCLNLSPVACNLDPDCALATACVQEEPVPNCADVQVQRPFTSAQVQEAKEQCEGKKYQSQPGGCRWIDRLMCVQSASNPLTTPNTCLQRSLESCEDPDVFGRRLCALAVDQRCEVDLAVILEDPPPFCQPIYRGEPPKDKATCEAVKKNKAGFGCRFTESCGLSNEALRKCTDPRWTTFTTQVVTQKKTAILRELVAIVKRITSIQRKPCVRSEK